MAQKIMMVWEYGANLGHISRLSLVIRELLQRGCEVSLILKECQTISQFLSESELKQITLLQTPRLTKANTKKIKAHSVIEILLANGFGDENYLSMQIAEWRTILDRLRPDLIIADYAPSVMLANRRRNEMAEVIMLGSGFGEIPANAAASSLHLARTYNETEVIEAEARLLKSINSVAEQHQLIPLTQFSDLYKVKHTFLSTIPELDFYDRGGTAHTYMPIIGESEEGYKVQWPLGQGALIFAYIRPSSKVFFPIIAALRSMNCRSYIFAPGLLPRDIIRWSSPKLTIGTHPVDLNSVVRDADLIIHHGGQGVTMKALSKGLPCALVPTQLEQQLMGWKVDKLGFGLSIGRQDSPQVIKEKLTNILVDPNFELAAERLRDRQKAISSDNTLKVVCDYVMDVFNVVTEL